MILFHKEDIRFTLRFKTELIQWIRMIAKGRAYNIECVNYIFCSDQYLLKINKDYLKHDDYTDIITFDESLNKGNIMADIFISIDRVNDNASKFKVSFNDELHRVMIHGLLHLTGLKDKNEKQSKAMRKAEDEALSKRKFIKRKK